jgi:hypothetical protein
MVFHRVYFAKADARRRMKLWVWGTDFYLVEAVGMETYLGLITPYPRELMIKS